MKRISLVIMAYLIELILAFLIVVLSYFTLERNYIIVSFILSKSDMFIAGVIAILCAKVAVFIYHMTITATDFGNYLNYVRADSIYKNSLIYSIGIDIICIILIIHLAITRDMIAFRLALFFCAMTVITLFTTLQNLYEVVTLNNRFNHKIKHLTKDEGNKEE